MGSQRSSPTPKRIRVRGKPVPRNNPVSTQINKKITFIYKTVDKVIGTMKNKNLKKLAVWHFKAFSPLLIGLVEV